MGPFETLVTGLELAHEATGKQSPLNASSWPTTAHHLSPPLKSAPHRRKAPHRQGCPAAPTLRGLRESP